MFDLTKVNREISFVFDSRYSERVSQFYTRTGDAKRKATKLNGFHKVDKPYKVFIGTITDIKESKDV